MQPAAEGHLAARAHVVFEVLPAQLLAPVVVERQVPDVDPPVDFGAHRAEWEGAWLSRRADAAGQLREPGDTRREAVV